MRPKHKVIYFIIVFTVCLSVFLFDVKITEQTAQGLLGFFSITFAFYISAIAIIYSSNSLREELFEVDPNNKTSRKIDIIKKYFSFSGDITILSIGLIILYFIFTRVTDDGLLKLVIDSNLKFIVFKNEITPDKVFIALILSASSISFVSISILFRFVVLELRK